MLDLRNNKKFKLSILSLILVSLITLPFGKVLAESISGDNVVIESNETLEKTSFLSGDNIRIDGNINGTTFITASNIEVNGIIDGDLFIAGQNATINGTVKGSVFVAGNSITINGRVENTVYLAGATLNVQSKIDGSAFIAGQSIYLEESAIIKKDAFIGAGKIYQNSLIEGDLSTSSEFLSIGGKIGGDLNYSSQEEANFLNGSEVIGETTWKEIDDEPSESTKTLFTAFALIRAFLSILAALIIWLVIKWLKPNFWPTLADKIRRNPLRTLGFGALSVVFIPLVSIVLMFTVIGIPLSLIVLSLYSISIYISTIILSTYFGLMAQNRFKWSNGQAFWVFLLGLIVLATVGIIPIVGMISGVLVAAFGVGSIVLSLQEMRV
ncbi:hypothetical protein [Carnobacterium sp.]|uniref:hypothetical protein n=1 Tax=Carnobacterium sp. TaxID=48221 RepID=UPI003C76CEC5